ncbi:hypothetical protein QQ020_17475 [Fulvivirgaceae bacterium BMA12]|uniref:Uncharacterized protein n=1 Tax=Agaribacillus aureus TaxID=3051825 RepID=A0ABT8L7Y7_9BACT|nr:hypothetical protein [Fulvivirgaceae bacterium BMA12]
MIRYIDDLNVDVLDIKELNELRKQKHAFIRNKKNYYLRKKLVEKTTVFFDWYIAYCKNEIGTKIYKDKQLIECILRATFKTKNQWKEYLLKSLYLSCKYVEYLRDKVSTKNISAFEHTLIDLEIDLEWLITHFEVQYKKSTSKLSLNSGRRRNLSPTDIYSAARTLFHVEELTKIEDLYLRDLKPNVMFQIRQLLEVFGRELIGYHSIEDKDGNPIKKFTQISWGFIKEEVKKTNSRIQFPFDVNIILLINKWSNSFVHTTYLYSSYVQFFVLKTIGILFASKTKGIQTYTGKVVQKFNCADIKISQYNSLKTDFENYLSSRMSDITVTVQWMETDKVVAYIISE